MVRCRGKKSDLKALKGSERLFLSSTFSVEIGHGMASRVRRGRLSYLLILCFLLSCSFVLPRPPQRLRSLLRAEPKGRTSMMFLAVKDAIYTALFGAPVEVPDVPGALQNLTEHTGAQSVYTWGVSKLQELGALLHLPGL